MGIIASWLVAQIWQLVESLSDLLTQRNKQFKGRFFPSNIIWLDYEIYPARILNPVSDNQCNFSVAANST